MHNDIRFSVLRRTRRVVSDRVCRDSGDTDRCTAAGHDTGQDRRHHVAHRVARELRRLQRNAACRCGKTTSTTVARCWVDRSNWCCTTTRSSADQVTKLYEKLITQDKVDFLISPYSSQLTLAAAAVAEKYGVPMVTRRVVDGYLAPRLQKRVRSVHAGNANMDPVIDLAKATRADDDRARLSRRRFSARRRRRRSRDAPPPTDCASCSTNSIRTI